MKTGQCAPYTYCLYVRDSWDRGLKTALGGHRCSLSQCVSPGECSRAILKQTGQYLFLMPSSEPDLPMGVIFCIRWSAMG